MLRLMHKGPEFVHADPVDHGGPGHFKTPMRPLSAATEKTDTTDQDIKEKHHD